MTIFSLTLQEVILGGVLLVELNVIWAVIQAVNRAIAKDREALEEQGGDSDDDCP